MFKSNDGMGDGLVPEISPVIFQAPVFTGILSMLVDDIPMDLSDGLNHVESTNGLLFGHQTWQ